MKTMMVKLGLKRRDLANAQTILLTSRAKRTRGFEEVGQKPGPCTPTRPRPCPRPPPLRHSVHVPQTPGIAKAISVAADDRVLP